MIVHVKTTEDSTTSKGDPYKRVKTSDGKTFSCFKENLLDLIKPNSWLDIEFTEDGKYKNITGVKITEAPAEPEQYVNDEEARRSCLHAAVALAQAKAQIIAASPEGYPDKPRANITTVLHDAAMMLKFVKGEIGLATVDGIVEAELHKDIGKTAKLTAFFKKQGVTRQEVETFMGTEDLEDEDAGDILVAVKRYKAQKEGKGQEEIPF